MVGTVLYLDMKEILLDIVSVLGFEMSDFYACFIWQVSFIQNNRVFERGIQRIEYRRCL